MSFQIQQLKRQKRLDRLGARQIQLLQFLNQYHKQMQQDGLLEINHTLTSIRHEGNHSQQLQAPPSIYLKTIRDLKCVHKKITTMKHRLNTLVEKHNRARPKELIIDPITTLRKKILEQQLQKKIGLRKKQADSESKFRKLMVQQRKQKSVRGIQRARRNLTQATFRSRDLVKEITLQNHKKIEEDKKDDHDKRQQRHNQLYIRSKKHKELIKNLQQERQKNAHLYSLAQTKVVQAQILKKKKQLDQIEKQCQGFQKKLKSIYHKKYKQTHKDFHIRKELRFISNKNKKKHSKTSRTPQSHLNISTIQ